MLARFARALALLLLMGQAIVAQAHLHAPVRAGAVAPSSVAASQHAAPAGHRPDGPLDCPVCREIAHAGQYVAPGPVALHLPAAVAARPAAATLAILQFAPAPLAWRSRAPPSPLLS